MGVRSVQHLLAIAVLACNTGLLLVNGDVKNSGANSFNALPESESRTISPFDVTTRSSAPVLDETCAGNVTALVGKSAYLSCRVQNLGNKTVSWIRHRDIHILTVGSYTYTSDQRFQATYHKDINDWTLQIKWAQKRDAGTYECQISTQPVMSFYVILDVVDVLAGDPVPPHLRPKKDDEDIYHQMFADQVPTAMILGAPDLHVDKGSTINLTCSIQFSPEPPAYIFWYHHDDVISYDSDRGGVSVITEKGEVTTSFLLIQNADIFDSGKYSCSPSNADVASVRVHVLNGERPAAMQTGSAGLSNSSLNILTLMIISYVYWTVYKSLQLESTKTFVALR